MEQSRPTADDSQRSPDDVAIEAMHIAIGVLCALGNGNPALGNLILQLYAAIDLLRSKA